MGTPKLPSTASRNARPNYGRTLPTLPRPTRKVWRISRNDRLSTPPRSVSSGLRTTHLTPPAQTAALLPLTLTVTTLGIRSTQTCLLTRTGSIRNLALPRPGALGLLTRRPRHRLQVPPIVRRTWLSLKGPRIQLAVPSLNVPMVQLLHVAVKTTTGGPPSPPTPVVSERLSLPARRTLKKTRLIGLLSTALSVLLTELVRATVSMFLYPFSRQVNLLSVNGLLLITNICTSTFVPSDKALRNVWLPSPAKT